MICRSLVLGVFFWGCQSAQEEELVDSGTDSGVAEEEESEWGPAPEDEDQGCADSWVLTYALEGRVDITHTPLNIGNADALVGGGPKDEVVLRLADDGGVPAQGLGLMTHFNLEQDFSVAVDMLGEIRLNADLLSVSEDECGVASGTLRGANFRWDECSYNGDHGKTTWSPDQAASGPGCLSDYHVQGSIECVDDSIIVSCQNGWLDEGMNYQDYSYDQPLLDFAFDSDDLGSFTMSGDTYGAELPTYTNNRTWLVLNGTLKSMELLPTPDCLCGDAQ